MARSAAGLAARTAGFTTLALVSFAANSWLCRAALRTDAIDPTTFTAVRIATGAAALALCVRAGAAARGAAGEATEERAGSWGGALALFAYALAFSLAYVRLDTGVGALVLFGAVQITMAGGGLAAGHRPHWSDVLGLALAFGGLVALAAPGRTAPDPLALAGMAGAGVAWGVYSLRGRGARRPLVANAGNFLRAAPLALGVAALAGAAAALGVALLPRAHAAGSGLLLAAVSGSVTSGLGYAAWYAALPALTPVRAGLVQLAAPVLAAVGGVILLGERPTLRLALSGSVVLAGIAVALFAPRAAITARG